MGSEHGQTPITRREFLKGSAAVGAVFAAGLSVSGATDSTTAPQTGTALFLLPHLACPTETTIRISALSGERPTEAVIEVRNDALQPWERREPRLQVPAYALLQWTVRDLVPGTRYEYRVLVKQGADDSLRPAADGSFRTQRQRPDSYTALLMTDPHTGSFPPAANRF